MRLLLLLLWLVLSKVSELLFRLAEIFHQVDPDWDHFSTSWISQNRDPRQRIETDHHHKQITRCTTCPAYREYHSLTQMMPQTCP
jgi:hypothetical protein